NTHDLLLIHNQAVGLTQNLRQGFFELGVNRRNFLAPVFTVGVVPVGVHTHRSWSVQRQRCHNILKAGWLHALEEFLHAAGVQLEHAEGVTTGKQVIDLRYLRVIGVQVLEVEVNATVFLDIGQRVTNDGEVTQTQKVHLQQANGFTRGIVPAGDIRTIGRALPHRDVVHQPHGRHNDGTRVHASLADYALKTTGGVINLFNIRVGFHHMADFRCLRVTLMLWVGNTCQRNILRHHRWWQRAVDPVSHLETRQAKVHLRGVFNCLLGLDRTEGNNLSNLVFAPALRRVLDHLTATAVIGVNIDIGIGGTIWVTKALKQQVVFNRVYIGNGQGISHQCTSGRTTAGSYPDTNGSGVLNNLGNDQEVGRVALHINDGDFILRTLDVFLWDFLAVKPVFETFHHFAGQPRRRGMTFRHICHRHAVVGMFFPQRVVGFHALGNPQGVIAAIWNHVVPQLTHLFRSFNVVARTVELEAVGIHQGLTGLHAQHRLVRWCLGFQHVVAVVGYQRWQVKLAADFQQAVTRALFDVQSVVHQLEEVIVAAVNVLPHRGGFERFIKLSQAQTCLHITRGATRGRDNAIGVLGNQFRVHARPLAQL